MRRGVMIPMQIVGTPPVRLSTGSKCGTSKHNPRQNNMKIVRTVTRFQENSETQRTLNLRVTRPLLYQVK